MLTNDRAEIAKAGLKKLSLQTGKKQIITLHDH